MKAALCFRSGASEAMKWIALVAMTLDHVNTFALDRAHPALYAIGRVAFPLFALVLASNLARPGVDLGKVATRLVLFGLAAAVPFAILGHWSPLNVMFTFAAAVLCMALYQRGSHALAFGVFLFAGAFVDYQWPGLFVILAAWWFFRSGGAATPGWVMLAAVAALAWPNGNWWALAALPVAFGLDTVAPHVPRLRWAFYAYYPAHLAVLAVVSTVA